jgi:molecular chaperone DnaK (HSP70)
MEYEFRVQGKNAKRIKEMCEKEGFNSPSDCADFLINIYTKKNKDTNTLKEIRNRYENATCVQCQRQIKLGEICYYDPIEHKVLCSNCLIRNNANSFSSKEIVKLELKKNQLTNQIKILQEDKKKLLNDMQIVQVYEELNNYPKELENLHQKIIKSIIDYGYSQDQNQKAKVLEVIKEIKELINSHNEKIEMLAKSLLRAKHAKTS